MNRVFHIGLNLLAAINNVTKHVKDAPQSFLADRYGNSRSGINCLITALQAVGRSHGYATDDASANMLLDFQG